MPTRCGWSPTAPAGEIRFEVIHQSKSLEHERVVVRLASAGEELSYDDRAQRVPEDAVDAVGEVSELESGASGILTLHLKAGHYDLLCNLPGHYAAGMWIAFDVI